jgi:predicted ATPase
MKFTQYFMYLRQRPDRACIRLEWIQQAIEHPIRTEVQSDGRIRKWTRVKELEKTLRVILLEDGETVHNAFFDRSFKEE